MSEAQTMIIRVFRFDPSTDAEPRYEEYALPYDPLDTVLGVLQTIRAKFDPSLVYRDSCNTGCCNICSVRVNGKAVLSCMTNVPGPEITIEPTHRDKVIRDLLTE